MRILPLLLLTLPGTGLASDCARQADFVRHLTERGDWYRAVTETYRLAWTCPDAPAATNLDLELGRLHLRAGWTAPARNHLYAWLASPRPAQRVLEARLLLCASYERDGDWPNALRSLSRLPDLPPETLAAARLKRAELLVKTLDPERDRELHRLRQELPSAWTDHLRLLEERNTASHRIPRRSPLVSDLLGVVPGLNLVYAGKPLQGLATFVSHAAMAGLIAWSVTTERWTLAVALAPTAVTWYTYNFRAGREAVHEFNERERRRFAASWSVNLPLP